MGVSFTLRGLNTQLSLIRKAGYPVHVAQDICGSYYLNLDMSASLFDNIFWFKTTNPELTGSYGTVADASDVAYYVNSNNWPDISYSHGLITNPDPGVLGARNDIDTFYVQPNLRFIGPAWLAKNITGGYNNSDLFENEDALQRQFVNFNGNFYKYVRFVFKSLVDASFADPSGEYYTTDVSSVSGYKRGFVGIEDLKFYENDTSLNSTDISAISYSSIYGETYGEGQLLDASVNHLFDDSSGTFWLSSEVNSLDELLYEASDPSINDASYIELGVYTRKYKGSKSTPYTLQLKNNDDQYVTTTISGEWLQFEFIKQVSFTKIDFRPVGDHTPDTDNSFVGTIPRSIAILTSLDGTNWEVLNDYDNLNINIDSNPFTSNPTYYKPLIFPNIKREIIGVLDASGGSASNPLTNADTGFNNISRDILKNMLDSDDPDTVQRVHTMILKHNPLPIIQSFNSSMSRTIIENILSIKDVGSKDYGWFIGKATTSRNYKLAHENLDTIPIRSDLPLPNDAIGIYDDNNTDTVVVFKPEPFDYHEQLYVSLTVGSYYVANDSYYSFGDTFGTDYHTAGSGEHSGFIASPLLSQVDVQAPYGFVGSSSSWPKPGGMGLYSNGNTVQPQVGNIHQAGDDFIWNGHIRTPKYTIVVPYENNLFFQFTMNNNILLFYDYKITHYDTSVVNGIPDPWMPIEFQAGDKMEFSLTYGISNITDSSNVALNSSGNRLGSNVVEDQDYYVRIHMN